MRTNITINCHSSIKINGDDIIYFDPYKIKDKIGDANYIFITHDHYDHLDIESIKNIMKEDTLVIMPTSIEVEALEPAVRKEQIISVCPNEQYFIGGMNVYTVPSYNTNKDFHKKQYNWVGYIIEINLERIYVAGDTDFNEDLKSVECDIALIPIGGTYTMDYKEAADFINKIKPKEVIPTHYGTIVGGMEDGKKFQELIDENIKCHLLIK